MLETTQAPNRYPNKWTAFIGIALLSFGCYLDYTVVNVALPTIQQELHANLVSLQWVMNIYFLALCVLATIMGRFADLYGRRRCFYLGAGIFALASVMAGLSSHIYGLILGRLLQGVGAAIVFPLGPSLLPQSFPEPERGKAIAWFGSLGGVALALGPVLGGLIVEHWGWRWIFFINIPIILIGFAFCWNSISESTREHQPSALDIKGMLLLALTLCGIVLALIHSQSFGWTNPLTLIYLVVGMTASLLLVKTERHQENPLLDFKDFSNLLFFAGVILCFLIGLLSAVTLFFDPLYLQIIKSQSPQTSGLVLFAIPIAVFLIAFLVGGLISRLGMINTIILGLALACLAAALQILFNEHTAMPYIVFAFILLGSAWAMGNTVSIIAAQSAVGHQRASVATGTVVTMFNIGSSIGLAIATAVYHVSASNFLINILKNPPKQSSASQFSNLKILIANPAYSLQSSMDALTQHVFNMIFIRGFTSVMWFLLVISLVILLIVLTWKRLSAKTKWAHSV